MLYRSDIEKVTLMSFGALKNTANELRRHRGLPVEKSTAMPTSIYFPKEQLDAMHKFCLEHDISRSALIRRAVGRYMRRQQARA